MSQQFDRSSGNDDLADNTYSDLHDNDVKGEDLRDGISDDVVELDDEDLGDEIPVDLEALDAGFDKDFDDMDDNPYEESDAALPEDSEEAAIAHQNFEEMQ